jgi:DNA-binding response OmpR family regulator
MKVLIAEDDFTSRTMLAAVLKKGGYEVVETINGTEAWLALQQSDAPRLVILDWMMPGIDGLEVLQLVRAMPTACPPYIIMLTARGGDVDIVAGLKAGADDYLTKPVEVGEILARVEVGQRTIEMALRHLRYREKAQIFRVEAGQRITELQAALADRDEALRQATAALQAIEQRFETQC